MEEFAESIKNINSKLSPSKSNVSRWERGENTPNELALKAIADLGGITVKQLLAGEESEEKANTDLPLYNGALLKIALDEAIKRYEELYNERLEAGKKWEELNKTLFELTSSEEMKEKIKKEDKELADSNNEKLKEYSLKIENLKKMKESAKKLEYPFYVVEGVLYIILDNVNDLSENDIMNSLRLAKYKMIIVRDITLDNERNIIYNKQNFTANDFVSIVKKYFDHGIRIELY